MNLKSGNDKIVKMRKYELILALRPIAEKDRKTLVDTIKSWLKDAKFALEESWGSKALKYEIKKELTGFYYDFVFDIETIPADFEKKLINHENVLRHLVIRKK